jgi:abortive infection bacteriophage resistance protein
MPKIPFVKPPLDFAQQIQQLKSRGLVIEDEQKALHLLETISYYRLSGYWYPFLSDKENHVFKSDATFNTAFKLYCFDRELRKLVSSEVEKIEVAIRSKMIYHLSHRHNAIWFQDVSLFSNPYSHKKTIDSIEKEYVRSDEQFIKAFKLKYSDPFPPSWIAMEIISFGTLSMLYKNLKPGRDKRDIAGYFGLDDSTFESWIHSIVYLRNVSAHHNRLWNREMSIRPQKPRTPRKQWLVDTSVRNNKTYFVLSMIIYLLQTVNPRHTFRKKFDALCTRYPNVDVAAMGFPITWESEPLWV